MGVSELQNDTVLSRLGEVTLILRTSSGEGKAEGKSGGPEKKGEVGSGEGGSRLWVESVRLWPLVRCHGTSKHSFGQP